MFLVFQFRRRRKQ